MMTSRTPLEQARYDLGVQQAALARETTAARIAYRERKITQLLAVIAELEAAAAPQAVPVLVPTVHNRDQLAYAMTMSQGGEVHILAPGDYGDLTWSGQVPMTLLAAGNARFGAIKLQGASGLTLDGIRYFRLDTQRHWQKGNCRDLTLLNVISEARTFLRAVDGFHITACDFTGQIALTLYDSRNGTVRGNRCHDATEDCFRIFGDCADILVEGNRFEDVDTIKPRHPDLIQIANLGGELPAPRRITIRRNLLWDDGATGETNSQGIFLGGPDREGWQNILIEENCLAVPHPQGIYVTGGTESVVIRNNTMIPNSAGSGANIRVTLTPRSVGFGHHNRGVVVEGNLCARVMNEGGYPTILENHLYAGGSWTGIPWDQLFPGPGRDWSDFLPLASAGIPEGMGARWMGQIA